jgi:hypothetical protein
VQEHTRESVCCTPPTVEDALTVARYGIAVIPLKPGTKEPAITGYKELATTNPAILRHWWQKFPSAPIGHSVERQELVIDVDPRHNGLVHWQNLCAQHGDLPVTWTVQSGRQDGGFHLSYAVPDTVTIPYCTPLAGHGVEALGHGHNIVMPPSRHCDTGQVYSWAPGCAPWELATMAWAPDWLIGLVLEKAKRHARPQGPKMAKVPRASKASDLSEGTSNKVPTDPEGGGLSTLFEAPSAAKSEQLVRLFCDPDHLPKLLDVCGLDPSLALGSNTRCPFHDDQHPSATVVGPINGYRSHGLFCHASACKRYYSLVDIYYYRTSGRILSLHTEIDSNGFTRDHKPLNLLWLTRMLDAAGLLSLPTELGLPSVPHDAPEHVQAVFAAFLQVRRLRAATRTLDAPLPFSLRFAQDWGGAAVDLSFHYVKLAKRWLIQHGYIFAAGTDHLGELLWTLGGRGLRRARNALPMFGPRAREDAMIADVAATEPVPLPLPTSACPEAGDRTHEARQCVRCIQARLEERRAQAGIVADILNPYGLRGVLWQPS